MILGSWRARFENEDWARCRVFTWILWAEEFGSRSWPKKKLCADLISKVITLIFVGSSFQDWLYWNAPIKEEPWRGSSRDGNPQKCKYGPGGRHIFSHVWTYARMRTEWRSRNGLLVMCFLAEVDRSKSHLSFLWQKCIHCPSILAMLGILGVTDGPHTIF